MTTLMINNSGKILAVGSNKYAQLGLGDHNSVYIPEIIPNIPEIKYLFGAEFYTLMIDIDGKVWGCGLNSDGQLGLGHRNNVIIPQFIENLPEIEYLSCGEYHTIMLDIEGKVWVCGSNAYKQLGLKNLHGNSIDIPQVVPDLPEIRYVSCGSNHTCLVDTNGKVWACGKNTRGKLGLGYYNVHSSSLQIIPNLPEIRYVSCGEEYKIMTDTAGKVWVCGINYYGQLGLGHNTNIATPTVIRDSIFTSSVPEIRYVSCGHSHTVMIDKDDNVWSCGHNKYGQLGLGTNENTNTLQMLQNLPKIEYVSCGEYNTVMIDTKGNVFSCGYNQNGELGFGHHDNVNIPSINENFKDVRTLNKSLSFLEKSRQVYKNTKSATKY